MDFHEDDEEEMSSQNEKYFERHAVTQDDDHFVDTSESVVRLLTLWERPSYFTH